MSAIPLSVAIQRLQDYLDAEAAVLSGQSYEIGDRRLTRANLKEIQMGIDAWSRRVEDLEARQNGSGRVRTPIRQG